MREISGSVGIVLLRLRLSNDMVVDLRFFISYRFFSALLRLSSDESEFSIEELESDLLCSWFSSWIMVGLWFGL